MKLCNLIKWTIFAVVVIVVARTWLITWKVEDHGIVCYTEERVVGVPVATFAHVYNLDGKWVARTWKFGARTKEFDDQVAKLVVEQVFPNGLRLKLHPPVQEEVQ